MRGHTRNPVGRVAAVAAVVLLATGFAGAAPESDIVRIHLMWTNDLHGHIAPEPARFMNPEFPPPLGGAASAARYIKRIRAEAEAVGEPVLLVDVGDMFQGTPIGNKTEGEAVIEYFNNIGYAFAVPGNHDFDLGRDITERLAKQSNFPWICANLIETETGEPPSWCQPTLMLDLAGIKVGVVGIITPSTAHMSFPENIAGLTFLSMPEAIAHHRDKLREAGADLVFLAIHEGLPYDPKEGWSKIADTGGGQTETRTDDGNTYGANASYGGLNLMEIVNLVPGIDFAVGGHTHRGYPEPWIDPVNHTMCFETYGNGSSIGHAILRVDRATGTLLGWEPAHDRGSIVTLFEDEIWPDEDTQDVLAPHIERTEKEMAAKVGEAAVALTRGGPGANLMGNLVTDAMREYFDADFSFQNLGGLRADLPPGTITAGDVFSVLPFGNELVLVEMDGRMIRRIIERKLAGNSGGLCISGVKVAFDKTRPDWDRAVELTVRDEPWDPDRMYTAVFTNFLLEGNSGLDFLAAIPPENVTPTQVRTAEAVERYLERHSPVRPRIDDRWLEREGQRQAPHLQVEYLP